MQLNTKRVTLLYGILGFNLLPDSHLVSESHGHLFNHGLMAQTSHKSASEVLTNHPAATAASCATLAKGVCMAITADKVLKTELNKPESILSNSAPKSEVNHDAQLLESK